MPSQFEVFVLSPGQLVGPLLAILLQATFFVTERVHKQRLSVSMPVAIRRPTGAATGRQFFYWLRRLGLAVAMLKIGHVDSASILWLLPGVALFAIGMASTLACRGDAGPALFAAVDDSE